MNVIDIVLHAMRRPTGSQRSDARYILDVVAQWLRSRGHDAAANEVTCAVVVDESDNP